MRKSAHKAPKDIYQEVTNAILAKLDEGTAPWDKPGDCHQNLISGHRYRGINPALLEMTGHSTPYWLTYGQARKAGGQIRKGEHATHIIIAKPVVKREVDADGQESRSAFYLLRSIPVFNLDQADGLEAPERNGSQDPIEAAEAICQGYADGPETFHRGDSAHYIPKLDIIELPAMSAFHDAPAYYSTRFHEMTHSTGSAGRLARDGVTKLDHFGSYQYGEEELIAEFGAAYLASEAGLETTIERSASYIDSWRTKIAADTHLAIRAASAAGKAADHILGRAVEYTDAEPVAQAA